MELVHLLIVQHGAADEILFVFFLHKKEQHVSSPNALRKNDNIIVHQKDMGCLGLLLDGFDHPSGEPSGTAYILAAMVKHMRSFDLFSREDSSVIVVYHMKIGIPACDIIHRQQFFFDHLHILPDKVFFLKRGCGNGETHLVEVPLRGFRIVSPAIDPALAEHPQLEAHERLLIFRHFDHDLGLLRKIILFHKERHSLRGFLDAVVSGKHQIKMSLHGQFQEDFSRFRMFSPFSHGEGIEICGEIAGAQSCETETLFLSVIQSCGVLIK